MRKSRGPKFTKKCSIDNCNIDIDINFYRIIFSRLFIMYNHDTAFLLLNDHFQTQNN